MPLFEGTSTGGGCAFALVASRFNRSITDRLLSGAFETLIQNGVREQDLDVAWVPGAFEIPLAAKRLASTRRYDGVLCLGAVIRGETPHFDLVASQAASGILQASLETGIPIIFSVLATNTVKQAEARSKPKGLNAGIQGACSLMEMVSLLKRLPCG